MSKVFKSIAPGSSATIEFVSADGNVTLYVDNHLGAIDLSAADAPALALAILEAAGIVPRHHTDYQNGTPEALELIAQSLKDEVAITEAAAKEAADLKALEGEALELYNKVMRPDENPLSEWRSTLQFTRIKYTKIATAAREIHGATK